MFMAEKGVDYENIQVDIIKGDNLNESFLSINPRGLLPTLVLDDGTVIDETVAICRYIEEMHPEPALLGTDAISKANIEARQRHMEFDGLLAAADAFRNSFPGFSSRGLAGNAGSVDAIPALAERGKNAMLRFYESLNAALNDSAFVAGETFSIADITALCTIDFAAGAARVPIPDQCSNVQRWHADVSSRPSAEA
jgi:glutathione S-transferase